MILPETFHNELINLLSKELMFYSELEKLLNEEKNSLAEFQYEKLNELNIKKEGILLNIIEIKNQRNSLINKICREFRIDSENFNLTFLINITPPELKNKYEKFKEQFKILGEKIKSLNEINKYVLETSLKFIQKSLQIMNQNINPSTYSNYGKITSGNKSSFYFNKI